MITIVSGMARSGTSLTMQMLKAAGLPIYWDREPNVGPANPRGYYELSVRDWRYVPDVENLLGIMEWHATKVFPRNWDYFTDAHRYQFIYLDRNPVDVRDSQRRMLELENRANEKGNPEEHLRGILAYRKRALHFLKDHDHIIVQYEELYNGVGPARIGWFLGLGKEQVVNMARCVDHSLHHFKEGK